LAADFLRATAFAFVFFDFAISRRSPVILPEKRLRIIPSFDRAYTPKLRIK
jgi:hypothetical protein